VQYEHNIKEHWNTIYINGDVPQDALADMISDSYDLTKPKIKNKNLRVNDNGG